MMDRRAALAALWTRSPQPKRMLTPTPAPNAGLEPYSGEWGFHQAAHLLRRTMFGPSRQQIQWAVDQGLAATLDKLLEELPPPPPPINVQNQDDSSTPIGSAWIEAPFSDSLDQRNNELISRGKSLKAWIFSLIMREGISIREKMVLFWHNHFPINEDQVLDPKFLYRNNALLRRHSLGNFRSLTKEITVDPAMLMYLNGDQNNKDAPNENYARELLELFTIGKGPLVAPGDYTNYTEQDIREIARVLTGWESFGYVEDSKDGTFGSTFNSSQHDTDVKQLSAKFDQSVISNLGAQEYSQVVDIIFKKEEVARFISRKLFRWFVYYQIDDTIENNVIRPMAQLLIDNDYEIRPALRALLGSQHFFDPANIGAMIKNPVDFVMSATKTLQAKYSDNPDEEVNVMDSLFSYCRNFQMGYYLVPEVAGWKAYYQEPSYYRSWINATTLPARTDWTDSLTTSGFVIFEGTGYLGLDFFKIIQSLENPLDPNSVVSELATILFPQPLSDGQFASLKNILIPGLPDYEWTIEYGNFIDNPEDSDLAEAIEAKIRALLKTMFSMAEFYLS